MDYVELAPFAIVVAVGGLVALVRALWLYGRTPSVRAVFLSLILVGSTAAIVGLLVPGAPWLFAVGLLIGYGPVCLWLVVRSISYTGPPPGLLPGPESLEKVEDAVDPIADLAERMRKPPQGGP